MQIDDQPVNNATLALSYSPPMIKLTGPMYLGGLPETEYVAESAGPHIGYKGCIQHLQVNEVEMSVFEDAVAGQNILECDVPLCQYKPCHNNATCHM